MITVIRKSKKQVCLPNNLKYIIFILDLFHLDKSIKAIIFQISNILFLRNFLIVIVIILLKKCLRHVLHTRPCQSLICISLYHIYAISFTWIEKQHCTVYYSVPTFFTSIMCSGSQLTE